MALDRAALEAAVAAHGRVVRVVVAEVKGSSPREVGAAMLVWPGGQSGTIGGGALEFEAAKSARARLASGARGPHLTRHALGPDLGQCCGGSVTILSEAFDVPSLFELPTDLYARPARGDAGPMPLAVRRRLALARSQGTRSEPALVQGWMVEPILRPDRQVCIWGAGHVGRALADVLAPLPDTALTWIDTAPERFPADAPDRVTVLPAAAPPQLAPRLPRDALHFVLTYSHELDLAICHALLAAGHRRIGLIGSATKRARFRSRLAALGHGSDAIGCIRCPIGDPQLGKHPQAIAVGVAAEILRGAARGEAEKDETA